MTDYKVSDDELEAMIKLFCQEFIANPEARSMSVEVLRGLPPIMLKSKKTSICFTGEAGAGKSALFSAAVAHISARQEIAKPRKRAISIDIDAIKADCVLHEQFKEKRTRLYEALAERKDKIMAVTSETVMTWDQIRAYLNQSMQKYGALIFGDDQEGRLLSLDFQSRVLDGLQGKNRAATPKVMPLPKNCPSKMPYS